ncbi:MAG: hypothetical protein GY849_16030, partial [Deltaproteobacteria bacterium]|nr:hypothetical protein [Deltaproteobacteria bacterium]
DLWLNRPDVRFAVAYHPTVYHPSFEGMKENLWWTGSPDFYFSPLSERRKHGPISREGMVPASQYRWIEVSLGKTDFPKSMRLMINNPGQASRIEIMPVDASGNPHAGHGVHAAIPSGWSGWIALDLSKMPLSKRLRIVLPKGRSRFLIGGIVFGNDRRHWPWSQKADLTFMPEDGHTGPISLSFDPAKILPAPLNRKKISVLDDKGSSVLFEIHQ